MAPSDTSHPADNDLASRTRRDGEERDDSLDLVVSTELLRARVRQQAAVAALGQSALSDMSLDDLMTEAVELLAETLDVEYAKVLELLPDQSGLLLRIGVGWHEGVTGRAIVSIGAESQAGYALISGQAVLVDDLRSETRFTGTPLLHQHGVVSGMSVIIQGRERPFGVLGAHSHRRRVFTRDDILFLEAVANILALAIQRETDHAELYRREQTFKAMTENAPDIISRFDRECRHIYVNHVVEEVTGMPADRFIGRTNRDLGMPDEQVELWDRSIRAVFETGEEQRLEFSWESDGGVRWFEARLSPEFGEDGTPRTVLGITREVTEQRVAVERLRRSEELFRSLASSSPVGILIANADGDITYLNPRCEVILGVPLSEVLGQGWFDLLAEADREAVMKKFDHAFSEGRIGEAEIRIEAGPDDERWISLRAAPVRGAAGEFSGYVGTLEDITEKMATERRLSFLAEASAVLSRSLDVQETMESVVDLAIPGFADMAMVHLVDDDGSFRNIAVAHIDPEIRAYLAREYRNNPPRYAEPHSIARVLRTERAELLPYIDETRWEQITHTPEHRELVFVFQPRSVLSVPLIARGDAIGVMTFVYSSSGRRYTESDLELAVTLGNRAAMAIDNARLYQDAQDAIRYRDEFLSIASHELKTPLTSVKGYTQFLEMLAGRPGTSLDRIASVAARVREQSDRLDSLITDLLDVSRIQQGRLDLRLSQIDLAQLAAEVLERYRDGLEITDWHHLELVAPEPVSGQWDSERIDQVLTNLVSNAVKYSPDGGTVRVEVRNDGDSAVLSVSDEGIGIPESDQPHLFEPFRRTGRAPAGINGTGLGLFIVRRIVEQHGGTVSVESEVAKGSRFTIRLPRSR